MTRRACRHRHWMGTVRHLETGHRLERRICTDCDEPLPLGPAVGGSAVEIRAAEIAADWPAFEAGWFGFESAGSLGDGMLELVERDLAVLECLEPVEWLASPALVRKRQDRDALLTGHLARIIHDHEDA